jgi:hypothetical protein
MSSDESYEQDLHEERRGSAPTWSLEHELEQAEDQCKERLAKQSIQARSLPQRPQVELIEPTQSEQVG